MGKLAQVRIGQPTDAAPCDGDVNRLRRVDLLRGAGALRRTTLADHARRLDPSVLREDARSVDWQEHSATDFMPPRTGDP